MTSKHAKSYFAYIFILAIAGIIVAIYTTLPYRAGVSSDAARNLATASNVLTGKGFFDYLGNPFLWWPPLYPLVLASLAWMAHLDIFIVGWGLNAVLFGINIWLSGLLFYKIFERRIIFAYLNSFVVFLSLPMLKISTNIASDPLFITLILVWFVLWGGWDGKKVSVLFWLIIVAAMAVLQRFLGAILISVGILFILIKFNHDRSKGLFLASIFGICSMIPLVGWVVGHNYLQYHTIFGPRNHQVLPWDNFLNATGKILDWFYPYYTVEKLFPYWFLMIIPLGIILLLANKRENWLEWLKFIKGVYVAPALFFSVIYSLALVFTTETNIQRYTESDRYQVVILFSLLVGFSVTIDKLILSHIRSAPKVLNVLLITLFSIWSIYPIFNLQKYITGSRKDGETSYNLYNTRAFNESITLAETAKILADKPDATVYSNIPGAVWFYTHHSLNELIPVRNWKKDEFKEKMAGWPYDKPGYIILFLPDPFEIYYPPKDLGLIANLTVISDTPDGVILYAAPRSIP